MDYKHFSRAVHADLVAILRPRPRFLGLIRDWVDVDLLVQIALQRSDWHFVLIGDADLSVDLGKYRSIPNMHFLGRKRYEELPAYCRHFDVGLIPFKINEADPLG